MHCMLPLCGMHEDEHVHATVDKAREWFREPWCVQPLGVIPDLVHGKAAASRSREAYQRWASSLEVIKNWYKKPDETDVAMEAADAVGSGLAQSASTRNVQAGHPFDEPGAKRAHGGAG